jgi:hypothetical protein
VTQLLNQHTELVEVFAPQEEAEREMRGFHGELHEITARWHRDMVALLEKYRFAEQAAHHRQQLAAVEAQLARSGVPAHG